MGIRDDELHAPQTAAEHALEESRPERFRLRRTDMQPDDLALAVGVHRHGDYRGNRDDPAALALLEVGCVQPQTRPLAGERAVEKGADAFVDVAAQLADRALADPRKPHGLYQI